MPTLTQSENRLTALMDERKTTHELHEAVVGAIGNEGPTDSQQEQIKLYREKAAELDTEIEHLSEQVEADRKAAEVSKLIRKQLAGSVDGVNVDDDGIQYESMATYARDYILTRNSAICSSIQKQLGAPEEVQRAEERMSLLKRTPANTLSSDVAGISVAQHIDQIFQVIDTSRPIVASATRADLVRGQLTYPSVDTRPIVSVQSTQKTEAGNQKMAVSLKTATASTYLGGGDLSWQAINWSTPNALDLWFQLCAADYALKTEQDAAAVIMHTGHAISSAWNAASGNFADLLSAIGRAAADVWTNSGRTADTVYMSMDAYWYVFGLTSTAFAQFATVSGDRVGPFRFVASRGLDAATVIAGDSSALPAASISNVPSSGTSCHSKGRQRGSPSSRSPSSWNMTRCQGGFRFTTSGTRMSASGVSSAASSSRIKQLFSQVWSSPRIQIQFESSWRLRMTAFRFSVTDADAITERRDPGGCMVPARLTVNMANRPISLMGTATVPGNSVLRAIFLLGDDGDLGHERLVVDELNRGLLTVDDGVAAME